MSLENYSNMNSVSIANSLGSGSRAPILIPEEYNSWVGCMNLHLNAINEDVWKCVEGTYITPENIATLATNQDTQTEIIRKLELQAKKELFMEYLIGNPTIHIETLYNLYGELQSYESSIDPPTTTGFGGPLALVSTTSQNQTPFNDQNFNNFNHTTSFQNQTFQSDSNDEADYQQLCALVANTNLQRFLLNHGQSNLRPNFQNRPSFGQNNSGFQPRPSFGQNNSGFQPRPYFGQNSQIPSFHNNSNQGFLNQ
uniref:Uncharacterized protein n=1 Tax=Lactuca sativa TaxID=4236 RepID=A0A9R1VSX5_LACSA|nr:hypothetical protein LSAT_V11C400196500 [Lactuca sativa]